MVTLQVVIGKGWHSGRMQVEQVFAIFLQIGLTRVKRSLISQEKLTRLTGLQRVMFTI